MFSPFSKIFPFYKQFDEMDCGPTCIRMVASYYGKLISREHISQKAGFHLEGVSIKGIVDGAESIGFRALPVSISFTDLHVSAPLPAIIYWRQRHYLVVYKVSKKYVWVADPAIGKIRYSKSDFLSGWLMDREAVNDSVNEGVAILIEPTADFYSEKGFEEHDSSPLKFLLSYLRPHHKIWAYLLWGLVGVTFIRLLIPFMTQAVVDYGIGYQNISFIVIILIAQIVLFASRTFLEVIRDWFLLHIGSRVNINILSDFLIKLMKLPINFFDSRNVGDLMQRVQDNRRVEVLLSAHTLMMIFSIVNLIVFGFVLAYFNINILFMYATGTIAYIVWILIFMKKREKLDYLRFDQMSTNQNNTIQIIQGMHEIKLNGSERRHRWQWEENQVKYFKIEMKNLSHFQIQRTGGTAISELKDIFIMFFSATAVVNGEISLGTLLSIQYIIGQLNTPVRSFIDFVTAYQDARISIDRIAEIHKRSDEDEEQNSTMKQLPTDKSIVVNNVSFAYPGSSLGQFVLRGVYITIPRGKITAIVGESGSGKTTLLKLLLKFYDPTDGQFEVGGQKLKHIRTKVWRNNCGAVMQDGFLFNDTIARNISESDSETKLDLVRLQDAIKMANLDAMIEEYPAGINTRIGYQGATLSGGQRQRLLIARVIYKNPEYLFFDEATSSLDANTEKVIMENLQPFYAQRTVVIVAHRLSTVKKADQIIVLDKGEVVEIGTHDELVLHGGKYYSLVKNQLDLAVEKNEQN